jgi:hypothetical protein
MTEECVYMAEECSYMVEERCYMADEPGYIAEEHVYMRRGFEWPLHSACNALCQHTNFARTNLKQSFELMIFSFQNLAV